MTAAGKFFAMCKWLRQGIVRVLYCLLCANPLVRVKFIHQLLIFLKRETKTKSTSLRHRSICFEVLIISLSEIV